MSSNPLSPVIKRSVSINGHHTSITLETPFWVELKRMAQEAGKRIGEMIDGIDKKQPGVNRSSALRVAVVADLKAKLETFTLQQPAE